MKTPAHWYRPPGRTARLLTPAGWFYARATRWRQQHVSSWQAPIPVICVGNLVAGGSGKTPVVLSLAQILTDLVLANPDITGPVGILARGYGGQLKKPTRVDPRHHVAADVGDEPLLLAQQASVPVWIARNRPAGAQAAVASGVKILILDDGFQDPALAKTFSLLVVDGAVGFGNHLPIPAGPLREWVAEGLARADAVVVVGEDQAGVGVESRLLRGASFPVLSATLRPNTRSCSLFSNGRWLAFAGIGRPEKFFTTLHTLGAEVAGTVAFPDHHPYQNHEVAALVTQATALKARLVTTTKDFLRLPPFFQQNGQIETLEVDLHWQNLSRLSSLLTPHLPLPHLLPTEQRDIYGQP